MPGRSLHILVVDPNPDLRVFLSVLLASDGHQVTMASSIPTARVELNLSRPDLVIADSRLPGEPPLAILDLLAADTKTRMLPLIVCTAAVDEIKWGEARITRHGAAVVLRPFDIEMLLDQVALLGTGTHAGAVPCSVA